MHSFSGDIGDVRYKILKIPTGLFQVGGVNDDLHQLQQENHNCCEQFPVTLYMQEYKCICLYLS